MNVLSLFDGMSCGQLAISRLGLSYDNYFASEVDKYAMKVTMANFPNTIQIGDVREVKASLFSDTPITLMMGGSPCQSFSFAGKRKGMSTKDNIEILSLEQYLELKENNFEFEGQSYLFWEYVRLLNEVQPKYFLLENVMMEERWEKVITKTIGVHPLDINSSLVSAQNRRRLYWTNIGLEPQGLFGDLEQTIGQPKDIGIMLKDILEDNPNAKHYMSERFTKRVMSSPRNRITSNINEKSNTLCARQDSGSDLLGIIDEKYFLSDRMLKGLKLNNNDFGVVGHSGTGGQKGLIYSTNSQVGSLCATDYKQPKQIICHSTQKRSEDRPSVKDNKNAGGSGQLSRDDGKTYWLDRANSMAIQMQSRIRRLTPVECERLQTVPDNYTNHVSDSQRYKMLGNGWTIDVIAHILKHMK